jgi:hypothetical protein
MSFLQEIFQINGDLPKDLMKSIKTIKVIEEVFQGS